MRSTHLVLDPEAVAAGAQTDLDEQGIAKNARQEKLAARAASKASPTDEEKDPRYHEQMAQLYRQHVLKEETPAVVQIQGLSGNDKSVGVG